MSYQHVSRQRQTCCTRGALTQNFAELAQLATQKSHSMRKRGRQYSGRLPFPPALIRFVRMSQSKVTDRLKPKSRQDRSRCVRKSHSPVASCVTHTIEQYL